MALLQELADAITRQEGYRPGTRAYRNKNPGNIWDGIGKGKTKRIWPSLPIDEAGYIIYPSHEAGRTALERQLSIKINRGLTLEQLITEWAPPSENPTETYIQNVSAWLGIPREARLSSWPSPAAPPTGAPAAPAAEGEPPPQPRPIIPPVKKPPAGT